MNHIFFSQWQVKNQFNKMKWQNPGPYLYSSHCVTVLIISFNWNYDSPQKSPTETSLMLQKPHSQPLIGYRQIQRGFNIGSSFIRLMILNYVVTWLKFNHWSLKWESLCVKFTRYKLYPIHNSTALTSLRKMLISRRLYRNYPQNGIVWEFWFCKW